MTNGDHYKLKDGGWFWLKYIVECSLRINISNQVVAKQYKICDVNTLVIQYQLIYSGLGKSFCSELLWVWRLTYRSNSNYSRA